MEKKILLVFGTRPEAIKLAPVITSLKNDKNFNVKVCVTAQHRQMLDQVLNIFSISPDYDLDIMRPNQTLNEITAEILLKIKPVLEDFKPDLLIVHGDTATTFSAALAAFYEKIKIGHIEAGLRTQNLQFPWPEEANRKLTATLTDFHFAPTENSKANLLLEGISKNSIYVTGNTVIDALFDVKKKLKKDNQLKDSLDKKFSFLNKSNKLILVTGHRRENFGTGFHNICNALSNVAKKNKNIEILYPVHLNPQVQEPVNKLLKNRKNIFLIEPQEYIEFCYLMDRSYLILTDSGGIQEEAPSLGKPVLVMRDTTERPEALKAKTVKLVGTNTARIEKNINNLINDKNLYNEMSIAQNPYGDGKAATRIHNYIKKLTKNNEL